MYIYIYEDQMLKVVLIDDEPLALQSMTWELEHFCKNVTIVATFSSVVKATEYLSENLVDCIFLDVEMPEMDGFQFLEQFPLRQFAVVITTAFDQYAIKAIRKQALDYLLKPIDSDELIDCIEKVSRAAVKTSFQQTLENTVKNFVNTSNASVKKVSIACNGKIIFINPDDIIYCESDGNYCTLFLENKQKILITQKLKFMEEKLAELFFFRIHNSYLVNLNKVQEYHKSDEFVMLANHVKLPVSRHRKAAFLEKL
ncbi:MAG: LytTR family DNA-binding domain-containing protein [Flavobacterium sp.]|nr:LytTR family DNA-binding domain-containing protein [Flavobacterium sp.]